MCGGNEGTMDIPQLGPWRVRKTAQANDNDFTRDAQIQEAQAQVDELIDYVNEQIELLAFDDADNFDAANTARLNLLIEKLIESLADPRRDRRVGLVDALGQIGETAVPFLLAALESHDESVVRRTCCQALSSVGDEAAVAGLVSTLVNDQDISVKSSAAGALAKIGAPAFDALRETLAAEDVSESSKGYAAWAIASMSQEVSERLYDCANDVSSVVRTAVIGAIAQLAQKQSTQQPATPSDSSTVKRAHALLVHALNDSSSDVRIEAIAHLARLNYQQARSQLIDCLQDDCWEVRKAAIFALGKLANSPLPTSIDGAFSGEEISKAIAPIKAIAPLKQDPVEAVRRAAALVANQLEAHS